MLFKVCLTFLVIIFTSFTQAYARNFLVESVNDFDLNNPPAVHYVRAVEDIYFSDDSMIEKGSIIKGTVGKIMPARRLERDAYITFVPVTFTVPSENNKEVVIINPTKTKIKNCGDINKKEVATNTGLAAAAAFVPVLNIVAPIVQFGIGVFTPHKDEHRFKAGCRALAESWPICYCFKGKEIPTKAGAEIEIALNKKMFRPAKVLNEAI